MTTSQGTAVAITLTGSDVDGNPLTYRVVSNPSHGTLSAIGTGILTAAASDDTWVNRLAATTNYGSAPTLRIDKSNAGLGDNEGLVRFGLPTLPAGASVSSAFMGLTQVSGGSTTGSLAVQARQVTSAWSEGTVTFATIPTYSGIASATTTVTTNLPGEYSWPLTGLVQAWYGGTANYGVLLGDTGSGTIAQLYATKESGAGNAPRLVINYSGAAVPTLIYTPAAGYSGPDSFTFVANDGQVDSAPATISIAVNPASDLIFRDGFESGNLSNWTSNATNGGALSVNPSATLVGANGLQANINNNTAMYVTDDTPNAEPRYRARFYFDPNSIAMVRATLTTFSMATRAPLPSCCGSNSASIVPITSFGLERLTTLGAGATAPGSLSAMRRTLSRSTGQAATAAGANNGSLALWIDGTLRATLAGVDNDTRRIDRVSLGPVAGIDTGTRGTYYLDAFESRKQTYIGP